MRTEQEALQDSIDFWKEEAKYNKAHYIGSLLFSACGFCIIGYGISSLVKGDYESGAVAITLGGLFTVPSAKLGLSEMDAYTYSTIQEKDAQKQLDNLIPRQN